MNDHVLSKMIRINRQWRRMCKISLAPYGYIGIMHLIVTYIGYYKGSSQEDIAVYYALDKTSVARDARRLEDMGHIRREIMPESRRQYRLYLTEKGEEMAEIIKGIYSDFQKKLSDCMPEEDWQTLGRLLGDIDEKFCFEGRKQAPKNG